MPNDSLLLLWRQLLRILYLRLFILRLWLVWMLLAPFLIRFWCLDRWLGLVALLVGLIGRWRLICWLWLLICHRRRPEHAHPKNARHNRPCQYTQDSGDAA